MRVLVLSTRYPPEHAGGYELHCQGNVRHLRRHGHEVRVLTSGPGPDAPGVARQLRRFPAAPEPTSGEDAERAERHNGQTLARHVADFRPDAVILWRMAELSMSLVERSAALPLVAMVCDTWPVDGPERDPWARRHGGRLPLDRGRWLFVSAALRDQLAAAGVRPARADVAHAGIEDPPDESPPPHKDWRGALLYAGRLSPLKGVDVAIRAVERVASEARLTVVGAGPPEREAELRAVAGRRVTFAGPRAHAAMPAVYAEADAVLFPSVWEEPWGLVPLEAMAAGTPVIATGTGGSSEYLRDEENCLLTPAGDAGALAAAVDRLAGDPALRARLVEGGRATARRYPAEACHAVVREALEQEAAA